MVLPGHLAGGYIAAEALLTVINPALSPGQTTIVYIVGTLAGELPDIDIAIHMLMSRLKRGEKLHHREYITHTPIFWLSISLLIVLIGILFSSTLIMISGLAVLAGTWSHFILDSIEFGICWLWPFTTRRFCIINPPGVINGGKPNSLSYYWKYITKIYVKRFSFYAEIAVVIIALLLFFN